jgi:hypothetical protein
MNTQFRHSFANRLAVAEVAGLYLAQTNPNTRLGDFIAHSI